MCQVSSWKKALFRTSSHSVASCEINAWTWWSKVIFHLYCILNLYVFVTISLFIGPGRDWGRTISLPSILCVIFMLRACRDETNSNLIQTRQFILLLCYYLFIYLRWGFTNSGRQFFKQFILTKGSLLHVYFILERWINLKTNID